MVCTRGFWPQGRERWVVIALLIMIAGIGSYTVYATFQLIEMDSAIEARIASNGRPDMPVFNMDNASIPTDLIVHGGPPKDGIPSIDTPMFVSVPNADLRPDDRVMSITVDGMTHVYPLRILQFHEIVNDVIRNVPVMAVYCPLCDSITAFDRRIDGATLEFGVSGLLYQSNVLIYDRQSDDDRESLWSQMKGEAVTGPRTGQRLQPVAHQLMCWDVASAKYPQARVLSFETGFRRDYTVLAYGNYFTNLNLMFPVDRIDTLFHPKERVLGIRVADEARAYPIAAMEPGTEITDTLGGKTVSFRVLGNGNVSIDKNETDQAMHAMWFAWAAFFPLTTVYDGDEFDLATWKENRADMPQELPMFETSEYNERHQSSCALSPSSSDTVGE